MNEEREELRQYIKSADIPDELKERQLLVVNNTELSIPEVIIELTRLVAEDFDAYVASIGITTVPVNAQVQHAYSEFERATKEAEEEVTEGMKEVDEVLASIDDLNEEVQKTALRSSLDSTTNG